MHQILIAETDGQIARCFPVMAELRPHLVEEEFVAYVRRLEADGYVLVFLEESGQVVSVAGYRVQESLARGRFMYVDDFVTAAAARKHGFGTALFDWLVTRARHLECASLQLDSGPARHDAHRFYESKQMTLSSRHYSLSLS